MNDTFLTGTRDCDLTEDAVDLICKKVICAAVLYTVHVFISLVIAINVRNINTTQGFSYKELCSNDIYVSNHKHELTILEK